jgi:hypothetical protein
MEQLVSDAVLSHVPLLFLDVQKYHDQDSGE